MLTFDYTLNGMAVQGDRMASPLPKKDLGNILPRPSGLTRERREGPRSMDCLLGINILLLEMIA